MVNTLLLMTLSTQSQNCFNRRLSKNNKSGFTGVSYTESRNKWRAEIRYHTKGIFLGHFNSSEKAIMAYEQAKIKYFGKFGRQNYVNSITS